MSAKKDWLPAGDNVFLNWMLTFTDYLFQHLTRFSFPEAEYQNLVALRNAFRDALFLADAPATRTALTVQAKNKAGVTLRTTVRQDVSQYLTYNPAVTDEDHKGLGIPIHSHEHHPSPIAKDPPHITALAAKLRQVEFDFGESETSKKKPAGQHGAEIAWIIADAKPASVTELVRSSFDTHTPLLLTFDDPERGKTLWYAARWENTRGEKGIWSEIMSVVIP
jgi:hypothetical protein